MHNFLCLAAAAALLLAAPAASAGNGTTNDYNAKTTTNKHDATSTSDKLRRSDAAVVKAASGSAMRRDENAAADPHGLQRLRASIDNLDAAIIHLLAERFRVTREVGHLKAEQALPPSDPQREARQVARLRRLASEAGLEPDFAEKFHAFVVAQVVRNHEAIAKSRAAGQ